MHAVDCHAVPSSREMQKMLPVRWEENPKTGMIDEIPSRKQEILERKTAAQKVAQQPKLEAEQANIFSGVTAR